MRKLFYKQFSVVSLLVVLLVMGGLLGVPKANATVRVTSPGGGGATPQQQSGPTPCGGGTDSNGNQYPSYTPSVDIGCHGKGNPIADATFAIIRLLSDGVGLIVIGSLIVAGIQYSGSRGDPQSVAKAITRIRSTLFALFLYIFSYAILNYVVPGQVLK